MSGRKLVQVYERKKKEGKLDFKEELKSLHTSGICLIKKKFLIYYN
jgi:hypothetical protein